MLLASHILISGFLGAKVNNYFLAAAIGFFSHYALDAIPHWDYYISARFKSEAENKKWKFFKEKFFLKELIKIMADILIGLAILLTILKNSNGVNLISAFISMFFGFLPDPLQLLYHVSGWKFLKPNHDFQKAIQKINPGFAVGILTQIAAVISAFLIFRF